MRPPAKEYDLDPRLSRALAAVVALCGAAFLGGVLAAPQRAWAAFLVGFVYATGLALSGAVFLALLDCSGARWTAALRRVPEAMSAAIPVAGAAGLLLLFGVPSLYEWSHPSTVADDPVLEAKSAYLDTAFFAARLVAYFLVWTWLARRLRAAAPGAQRVGRGALFMAAFAVTFSLASVDWLMSLDPHWSSTMFGLVTLSGLGLSGLAAAAVVAIHLRRAGALPLTDDHVHDIAKLLFAFSLFWSYVWYCQYMLIWYTNMPEETSWYAVRRAGVWGSLTTLSLVVNGAVPFLALLLRRARRSEKAVFRVALALLAGRAIELFVMAGPPLLGDSPSFGVWEIAPVAGLVALVLLVTLRTLARGPVVRAAEPGLDYSLHHHA